MKDMRWTQLRLMQRIKHLDFKSSLSSKTIVTKMKIFHLNMGELSYWFFLVWMSFLCDVNNICWMCSYICLCKFLYDRCFLQNESMSIVVHCFIVYCQSALRQFVNAFWFLLGIVIHIIKLTMDKRFSSKKLKNLAKLDKFTIYRSDALINVYIITKTGIQTNIISQRYKNLTSIEVILLWTLNWNWRK